MLDIEHCRQRIEFVSEGAEEGEFEAVASALGSVARGEKGPTVFAEHAFERSLKARGGSVPLLWQHKDDQPVGVAELRVEPGVGLVARCKLALPLRQASEARELMRLGALNNVSIGFTPKRSHTETLKGETVRVVDEADVMELSLVTFPADACAVVRWVHRSAIEAYLDPAEQGRREYQMIRDRQREAAEVTDLGAW